MSLTSNSYGKIRVRFMSVKSYYGDNSKVIPTDTIKNTVYVVAGKTKATCLEEFGLALAAHFLQEYSWVASVTLSLSRVPWERLAVGGRPHPHAFVAASWQHTASISADRSSTRLVSGIKGLRVFKTCGSAFVDYHTDRYTSLRPAADRTLSTEIECSWVAARPDYVADLAAVHAGILELFALLPSPSVQDTLRRMGEELLARRPGLAEISFVMPNIHYWQFQFAALPDAGTSNPHIYVPQPEPSGYITGTVSRTPARL